MSSRDPKEQEDQESNLRTGGNVQTKGASKRSDDAESRSEQEQPSSSETKKDQ